MPEVERPRPGPEQLPRRAESEERLRSRGKLKVFLGYASGVGKSFRMLDEGRRRKLRGQDVVVAAVQPSAAPEVGELLLAFEIIPPSTDPGSPAIDVPAVLQRHPEVCLIDGLAYENPPGSKNTQRWIDVQELLAAGISVITTINVQYVKEKQAQVEAIRGKAVKESVPEAFLRTADEIEIVDAPCPQTGDADAPRPRHEFSELREIALLLAAEVVDHQLERYLRRHGIQQIYGTHERILVCITPRSNAAVMIQRGRSQADRFHGELHVIYVEQGELSPTDETVLSDALSRAHEANATVEILHGDDAVESILGYAAAHGITQIFVGHSQRAGWAQLWKPNQVERLILEADGIDIRIFPNSEPQL